MGLLLCAPGCSEPQAGSARPLSDRGLDNLVAFTRLLGYVRHFHPSDEAASSEWNSFAVNNIGIAEEASDSADLATRLQAMFQPLAPTLLVFPTADEAQVLPHDWWPESPGSDWKVVSYRHTGCGQVASPGKANTYKTERVTRAIDKAESTESAPDPRRPFHADLGAGVSCTMPLAVFADENGTLPRGKSAESANSADLAEYSGDDRATRLADVALCWNVLQHFYPYFDVVDVDWPGSLRMALTSAATDLDEKEFLYTLRRMMADLKDGHGGVDHECDDRKYEIPVRFRWIENCLVITDVDTELANGLQPGDVVLKIDDIETNEAIREQEEQVCGATPQFRRWMALCALRKGTEDSEVKLEIERWTGELTTVLLRRELPYRTLQEKRPLPITEIKPGIFYLDLERVSNDEFESALPMLEQAQGMVFDIRGYPKLGPDFLRHLTDVPLQSARWLRPVITEPDHKSVSEYDTEGRWDMEPLEPLLKAKLVFLTDERAISYAESVMGIVEAYRLGPIVGTPTAGCNGNVNPFALPGGYEVWWTGMKVLKHDGSQHHGVGILPTVPVSRTIRGVAEGRDEQLEHALAIVSE